MRFLKDVIQAYQWDQHASTGISKKIIGQIEKRLGKWLPEGQDVALTALQRKVLNHPLFRADWKDPEQPPHNLIIQGATSAGKTLVSEISVVDVLENSGKAIILVPLKAMVRERVEQLSEDILSVSRKTRIYGSSSDYLDHDEHIINGEYEVAVIVYEKYFAFLSQGGAKMLNNCKLVVVDELSMLSKEDRGPKLEMALEITRTFSPGTRIICLATSDCKAEQIAQWLDAGQEGIIRCPLRPISLDEHIIRTDGTGRRRHIPSEQECDEDELDEETLNERFPPSDIHIEIPGYSREMRERDKKERLLMSIVRSVYQRKSDAKLLVFVASKADTKRYSSFLLSNAEDIFRNVTLNESYRETMQDIDACDEDDDRDAVKALMQKGIAYHNSGVSTNLREVIEAEFQRVDSPVKVIVATETLTVGVNMPFDVMIMMDCKVPKGKGARMPLTNQEYRNYIGRAGRLGLSGSTGETYLFVNDESEFNTYWGGYYKDAVEISSALTGTNEEDKAPYYLSLLQSGLKSGQFMIGELEELYRKSLAYPFEQRKGLSFDAPRMLEALKKAMLVDDVTRNRARDDQNKYKLTHLGRQIAPFALSMYTCRIIYYYFMTGADGYGLPVGVSQQDIDDDRYLLEMLFHICMDKEVDESSNIIYPTLANSAAMKNGNPMANIRRTLNAMLQETAPDGRPKHLLWSEDVNELGIYRVARTDMNDLGLDEIQAAMRAILVYYWTQGMEFKAILKQTQFHEFLRNSTSGDLERLAEIVSFHLEAIYSSLKGYLRSSVSEDGSMNDQRVLEDASSFYALQTRVKYGMKRDLVVLANKHVHGLDRRRLLLFSKQASERGISPYDHLLRLSDSAIRRFMSPKQRNLLIQRMEQRFNSARTDFDTLCDVLRDEQPGERTERFVGCLQDIMDWEGESPSALYRLLVKAFSIIRDAGSLVPDDGSERFDRFEWDYDIDGDTRRASFAVVGARDADERAWQDAMDYLNRNPGDGRIVIVYAGNASSEENSAQNAEMLQRHNNSYDLALSSAALTSVLLQAFKEQNQAAYVLFQYLTDSYGVYLDQLRMNLSMQNYLRRQYDEEDEDENGRFYLLASYFDGGYDGKTVTQIKNGLVDVPKKSCFVLPWGDGLLRAIDAHWFDRRLTLIYLNRDDVVHSKSLTKFMYHMANQHYENCYALLGSSNMGEEWMDERPERGHVKAWHPRNRQIRCLNADDMQEVIDRVRSFRPGDWYVAISYAHYDANARTEDLRYDPEGADRLAITKLDRLYEALVDAFGEHRVFYDQNPENQMTFVQTEARKRSLAVYRACRFGLFLCNYWSIHNENCQAERAEVKRSYREGKASYLYLTTNGSDACPPDDDRMEYAVDITDTDSIIRRIRKALDLA